MGFLLRDDGRERLRKFPWIVRRQMIRVKDERVIKDYIQHSAARQFRFRTACK